MSEFSFRYPPIVVKLNPAMPAAYVFALQAKCDDAPLTGSQIEAARNAAKSVLEVLGAEVDAVTAVLDLDPIDENQEGTLTIDVVQHASTAADQE